MTGAARVVLSDAVPAHTVPLPVRSKKQPAAAASPAADTPKAKGGKGSKGKGGDAKPKKAEPGPPPYMLYNLPPAAVPGRSSALLRVHSTAAGPTVR